MPLLTSLLALIVTARLLGHLFVKWGQPAIVGEMIAGVLLGPGVLGLIQPDAALSGIASLAIFLVVLAAGLEMSLHDVVGAMRGRGLIIALAAFALPFAAGLGVAWVFDLDLMRSLFIGLCISITALPVAVKMLDDMGLLGDSNWSQPTYTRSARSPLKRGKADLQFSRKKSLTSSTKNSKNVILR